MPDKRAFNILAKSYSPLDYYPKLIEHLQNIYPTQTFSELSKYELHHKLNNALFEHYKGEEILKYKLFERYQNKKDVVAAFEIKVNNSRADFLTVNNYTESFEIKSALDNFSKFSKQANDYMMAFEYNYLVIDECHLQKAQDTIPANYGLWSFKNGEYRILSKASLNNDINPEIQLNLLTKKERINQFSEVKGSTQTILSSYSKDEINAHFKKALKSRYKNRWEFIVENQQNILPIDIQFFFNTNVKPNNIYES